MAPSAWIEHATCGLGNRCSISKTSMKTAPMKPRLEFAAHMTQTLCKSAQPFLVTVSHMRSQRLATVPNQHVQGIWRVRQLPVPRTLRLSTPPSARHKGAVMATSTTSTWLTTTELLSELQVSRSTFDLWRIDGRGPRCYKMPNGQIRIRRADLEEWLSDLEEVLV